MALHDAEKRRQSRVRSDGSDDGARGRDGDHSPPAGVVLVAVLAAVGGAIDLGTGALMVVTPLFPVGIVLATLGGVKLWAAVGLYRLRTKALGIAILLFGVSALVGVGGVMIAHASEGSVGREAVGVAVDVVVLTYLLFVADSFE